VPYQTFRCKSVAGREEQYVVVGAGNDAQFRTFCRVLDVPGLADDDRFATNADRVAYRDILVPILEEKFLQKTRDEWVELLQGRGFPAGPVRNVPEAFSCEQALSRDMVMELDHPVAGRIRLPGYPVKFTKRNGCCDVKDAVLPPPMLGQHTEEILRDILHVSPGEIRRLEESGVIQCWKPHD
jgi:crotonobetainyl-CoA:carnitine CoA-transferase CaiB-like acyl-CoA transferase